MDLPEFILSLAPVNGDDFDPQLAIERAAKLFDATPRAVKGWLYRERYPRRETAHIIVQRSKGKVDLAGIYAPKEQRPQ
jgi:hypothetical protein